MTPLGLMIAVLIASMSSVGCAPFREANLPDEDTIETIVEIETKYLGLRDNLGDTLLEPSETGQRLKIVQQVLDDIRTQAPDEGLERRARVVKQLIDHGRTPNYKCDEIDLYEHAILSSKLDRAPHIAAYLKFHASTRIAYCASVELNKATGGVTLDVWEELQQLMSYIYREAPPEEGVGVPAPTTVAKGVVEYMRQKKALSPTADMTKERFEDQFKATVEPICENFTRAVGPAAGIFRDYTKSDLGDQMSAKDIALLNLYEVCSIAQAYWAKAYEIYSSPADIEPPK